MQLKRVVITGMGALTPIGNSVRAFKDGLLAGASGAGAITRFDATNYKTRFACEVKGFDPLSVFDRKESQKVDLYAQFAMAAASEAISDSGMNLDTVDRTRIGVIWSSGIGGLGTFEEQVIGLVKNNFVPRFNPFFIPKMIANMASGLISIRYGFHGVNFTPVSACASSSHALIDAFNFIRLGKANAVIAGGSEASITPASIGGFSAMKALSERNDAPEQASRPFDKDRDGFVAGEGAGGLVLEELEHALQRGANIYAEVVGGGAAADAFHMAATHPEGLGAVLGMREALREANLEPSDIDYINMHATSTPVGDPSESKAIATVFGDHVGAMHVSATKSMTGHLLGAAGAIEAVATVLAMQHSFVPPTINLQTPDEALPAGMQLTPNTAVHKPIRAAMSNTFGFGGHVAVVAMKQYEA